MLGLVISNILVYHLVDYASVGFAIVCSYFSEKEEIGYLYQKTLGICFLICIATTPLSYLSDKALFLLSFDRELVDGATDYAWALVPSFYLYAFLTVNKNYLQSQGVIFLPILLHLASFLFHLFICTALVLRGTFDLVSSAWIKNFSDAFCCILFYVYVTFWEPTPESWVEWSSRATNNIGRFLK